MMDELIQRLRDIASWDWNGGDGEYVERTVKEAADALKKLLAERNEVNADSWKTAFEIECDEHRWISVNEKLPSNGTKVLVFEFGRVEQAYTTTYTADGSLCWVVINGGSYHRISDADCSIKWWMPLPEPPKEE